MRFSATITMLALAAVASTSASASSNTDSNLERRHAAPVHRGLMKHLRRAVGAADDAAIGSEPHYVQLQKRYGGRATFYNNEVSEGACGGYTSSSDYIVALNVAQYGNPNARSSWCGKKIKISYGGKTETATVVDCCPTCPSGGLDMSKGLFGAFADFGLGIFQMTWTAVGEEDDSQSKKSATHTHTSHTQKPTTHTSHSTKASSTTSSSSSTSSTSTTSSSTTESASTATATTTAVSNLNDMSEVLKGLMEMAQAGKSS